MGDFINQLPDDILISIIARVPTKEAVRTSVLSKRWRNLYKFVSTINIFCHCHCPDRSWWRNWWDACDSKVIIDGMHRFSQLHSGFIRSFNCRCCLTESYLQQCIYSLGNLGIEKFDLQVSCKWKCDLSFSCHLLSHMPSLKYFKLRYCSLQPSLKTHCGSLKTLRLSKVTALPDSLECILSNCLSLCSLMIKNCEFPSKLCFRGPNLQLKCIAIYCCEGVEEIELYASNLITFEFYSAQMVNFIFDYVPRLQNIFLSPFKKNMSYVHGRLGKDLPRLKSSVLDTEGDIYQDSSISMGINMFSNLKRLELTIWLVYKIDLFSLTPLLHNCPLLQEFHLTISSWICDGPEVEKRVVFHSQLKNVYISEFGKTKNEIDFALYIVKSAIQLQQMYICSGAKTYFGLSGWKVLDRPSISVIRWSKETYENIHKQLKHQAVSKTLRVIIGAKRRMKIFTNS